MTRLCVLAWTLLLAATFPALAEAGFSCSGVLSNSEQRGFEAIFTPRYGASLHYLGGGSSPENMVKRLTAAEVKRLATPRVAVSAAGFRPVSD